MITLLVFASIVIISALAWVVRIRSKLMVCPICVGVSVTWLWMLVASYLGVAIDTVLLAMLMGGSVVGLTYTLSKKLPAGAELTWKILSIPVGFWAVYSLLSHAWALLLVALLIAAGLYAFFFRKKKYIPTPVDVREIEEKLKNCC